MDSRKHTLLRVYTSKNDFSDLLLLATMDVKFKNGNEVTGEFTVRVTFEGDTSVDPKGTLYQIYAVSYST